MKTIGSEDYIKEDYVVLRQGRGDEMRHPCMWVELCPTQHRAGDCEGCPADFVIEKVTREGAFKWWREQA